MANIANSRSRTLVSGTEMSDSITNKTSSSGISLYPSKYVTIDAGGGNDTIANGEGSSTCSGDYVGYVSINGGDGKDSITNYGSNVTIDGGAGNDSITTWSSIIAIDAGEGDDYIKNGGIDVSITGGTGNDTIEILYNRVVGIFYSEGDGNDIIYDFNSSSMIKIGDGSGTYATQTSGSDVIVYIGDGSIVLSGAASLGSDIYINGVESELPVWRISGTTATYGTSTNAQITIKGIKSLDGISLSGTTVTIAASALNKSNVTISNGYKLKLADDVTAPNYTAASWSLSGNTATYSGASNTAGYELAGNQINYVKASSGDSFTISGVKSASGFTVSGKTVTVPKAALNQQTVTISNSNYSLALASNVTLSTTTAAGWSLSGTTATYKTAATTAGYRLANNQISYVTASGGSTVTVSGVKSLDGLSISGSTVTVSNASLSQAAVTISDGYNLALGSDVTRTSATAAHWSGTTYKSASNTAGYQLSDNQISYVAAQAETDLFTISGVKNTAGIAINGTTVTVASSALNQETVTISNGYTLALADDVTTPKTTAAGWSLSGTTATYKNTSTSAGYSIVNNQIVYSAATGGETLITVKGVKSTDGLSLSGSTVTVANSALNQANVTISDGYTLALANDVSAPKTTAAGWSLSGTTATYKNTSTSAGYQLSNNQIVYSAATGGASLVTVHGVKSTDGLSLSGSTVTVANSALNQANVTISNGYTLALADDVAMPKTTAAGWSLSGTTATYKNSSTSAGYQLSNNQIVYSAATGGATAITIDGVKSLNGISQSGSTITIANASLNQQTVSISDGYTLEADYDVPLSTTTAAAWSLSGSTATYKNAKTTAGYQLVNNQLVYKADSGGDTLVTVSGVKATKGLTLDGTTVKVGAAALNKSTVTISEGYTLALADDVTTSKTTAAGWKLSGTTATYKNTAISAGYKLLANNQIAYNAASGGETLITVKGVKSLDGISLDGKTVKVAASALNKAKVTLSGSGYKLALADEVGNPETTKAWTFDKKAKASTYNQTTTAGYTLASDGKSITYSKKATTGLVTVKGVKSASGLSVSKKVVTVGAAALDKKAVTVSDGYTLKLGSGVSKPKTKDAAWTLSGSTATYKSSYKTAGYTLASNSKSIGYTAATTAKGLATVKGAASKSGLSVSGSKITLKNSALKNKVTVSGGYNFNFASDYKNATITGSSKGDTITTNGSKLLVSGGKGNDTLKIFGTKTTVKGGAGSDVFIFKSSTGSNVISDYAAADKISVAGTAQVAASGSNIVLTAGKNKITVTGGKDKQVSYIDAGGENIYDYSAGVKKSGATITLLKNYLHDSFDVASYGDALQTIDGSAVVHDIEITGNKLMNSIKGGANNDTLRGGKGNDTLTGGDGSDVFIYAKGDGNDLITDYAEEDKIKIASGTASVKKSGKDVIFTVSSHKITVKGAASKTVTYIDANGKTKYFPKKPTSDIILTADNTTAILRETYSDSTYTAGSSIKKIDASAVQRNLSITGNGKANVILGGSEDDTIYGGKGNDTLQGGSGADIFTYANGDGKDIIVDYNEEDTIQITSGKISKVTKGDDVIFTIGSGKITVLGAADKTINITNASGVVENWFIADDDFATANDLSALVQSKAADYSLAEVETSLKSTNALDELTYSDKK